MQQIEGFRKAGIQMELVDSVSAGFSESSRNPFRTFQRRKAIFQKASDMDAQQRVDFFYTRYSCGDPSFLAFAKQNGSRIITEHQTNEENELKATGEKIRLWMEKVYGPRVLREVAAIVGVTDEIIQYEMSRIAPRSIPSFCLGNGIDPNQIPVRTPPPFDGTRLNMLCVAHVNTWHALDRVIKGMAEYTGSTRIFLNVVGDGAILPELKSLVREKGLGQNVKFHGVKNGKDLDAFFEANHVAVGSLGVHRIHMRKAAILKNREYCSRGIPFFYAFEDVDFPENFPFHLRFPGNDAPVHMQPIVDFVKKIHTDPNHPKEMRLFSQNHLSWEKKMVGMTTWIQGIFPNPES